MYISNHTDDKEMVVDIANPNGKVKLVILQKIVNGMDVLLQAAGRVGIGHSEPSYMVIFKGLPDKKIRKFEAENFVANTAVCLKKAFNEH